ncbi:hypothetical protein BE20_44585 [Sorangium cellulosum]|nr:hypothetical protein BE20_44585 [Sorangium cellulosum]
MVTGSTRAPAAAATRKAPGRNGKSRPVALRVPSGKNTVDHRRIRLRCAAPRSATAPRARPRSTGVWP